jgi:hypothetical protein
MLMSREKIQFPTVDAYRQGLALLGDTVPVYVRNEKRRVVAAGEIPSRLRTGLVDLGATVSEDERHDAETESSG